MPETAIPPPVDLEHLARQTGGDESLAREALRLFLGKAPTDLDVIARATDEGSRRRAAHALRGSALAVGATEIARLTALVEREGDARVVADLAAATEAACGFIAGVLARV